MKGPKVPLLTKPPSREGSMDLRSSYGSDHRQQQSLPMLPSPPLVQQADPPVPVPVTLKAPSQSSVQELKSSTSSSSAPVRPDAARKTLDTAPLAATSPAADFTSTSMDGSTGASTMQEQPEDLRIPLISNHDSSDAPTTTPTGKLSKDQQQQLDSLQSSSGLEPVVFKRPYFLASFKKGSTQKHLLPGEHPGITSSLLRSCDRSSASKTSSVSVPIVPPLKLPALMVTSSQPQQETRLSLNELLQQRHEQHQRQVAARELLEQQAAVAAGAAGTSGVIRGTGGEATVARLAGKSPVQVAVTRSLPNAAVLRVGVGSAGGVRQSLCTTAAVLTTTSIDLPPGALAGPLREGIGSSSTNVSASARWRSNRLSAAGRVVVTRSIEGQELLKEVGTARALPVPLLPPPSRPPQLQQQHQQEVTCTNAAAQSVVSQAGSVVAQPQSQEPQGVGIRRTAQAQARGLPTVPPLLLPLPPLERQQQGTQRGCFEGGAVPVEQQQEETEVPRKSMETVRVEACVASAGGGGSSGGVPMAHTLALPPPQQQKQQRRQQQQMPRKSLQVIKEAAEHEQQQQQHEEQSSWEKGKVLGGQKKKQQQGSSRKSLEAGWEVVEQQQVDVGTVSDQRRSLDTGKPCKPQQQQQQHVIAGPAGEAAAVRTVEGGSTTNKQQKQAQRQRVRVRPAGSDWQEARAAVPHQQEQESKEVVPLLDASAATTPTTAAPATAADIAASLGRELKAVHRKQHHKPAQATAAVAAAAPPSAEGLTQRIDWQQQQREGVMKLSTDSEAAVDAGRAATACMDASPVEESEEEDGTLPFLLPSEEPITLNLANGGGGRDSGLNQRVGDCSLECSKERFNRSWAIKASMDGGELSAAIAAAAAGQGLQAAEQGVSAEPAGLNVVTGEGTTAEDMLEMVSEVAPAAAASYAGAAAGRGISDLVEVSTAEALPGAPALADRCIGLGGQGVAGGREGVSGAGRTEGLISVPSPKVTEDVGFNRGLTAAAAEWGVSEAAATAAGRSVPEAAGREVGAGKKGAQRKVAGVMGPLVTGRAASRVRCKGPRLNSNQQRRQRQMQHLQQPASLQRDQTAGADGSWEEAAAAAAPSFVAPALAAVAPAAAAPGASNPMGAASDAPLVFAVQPAASASFCTADASAPHKVMGTVAPTAAASLAGPSAAPVPTSAAAAFASGVSEPVAVNTAPPAAAAAAALAGPSAAPVSASAATTFALEVADVAAAAASDTSAAHTPEMQQQVLEAKYGVGQQQQQQQGNQLGKGGSEVERSVRLGCSEELSSATTQLLEWQTSGSGSSRDEDASGAVPTARMLQATNDVAAFSPPHTIAAAVPVTTPDSAIPAGSIEFVRGTTPATTGAAPAAAAPARFRSPATFAAAAAPMPSLDTVSTCATTFTTSSSRSSASSSSRPVTLQTGAPPHADAKSPCLSPATAFGGSSACHTVSDSRAMHPHPDASLISQGSRPLQPERRNGEVVITSTPLSPNGKAPHGTSTSEEPAGVERVHVKILGPESAGVTVAGGHHWPTSPLPRGRRVGGRAVAAGEERSLGASSGRYEHISLRRSRSSSVGGTGESITSPAALHGGAATASGNCTTPPSRIPAAGSRSNGHANADDLSSSAIATSDERTTIPSRIPAVGSRSNSRTAGSYSHGNLDEISRSSATPTLAAMVSSRPLGSSVSTGFGSGSVSRPGSSCSYRGDITLRRSTSSSVELFGNYSAQNHTTTSSSSSSGSVTVDCTNAAVEKGCGSPGDVAAPGVVVEKQERAVTPALRYANMSLRRSYSSSSSSCELCSPQANLQPDPLNSCSSFLAKPTMGASPIPGPCSLRCSSSGSIEEEDEVASDGEGKTPRAAAAAASGSKHDEFQNSAEEVTLSGVPFPFSAEEVTATSSRRATLSGVPFTLVNHMASSQAVVLDPVVNSSMRAGSSSSSICSKSFSGPVAQAAIASDVMSIVAHAKARAAARAAAAGGGAATAAASLASGGGAAAAGSTHVAIGGAVAGSNSLTSASNSCGTTSIAAAAAGTSGGLGSSTPSSSSSSGPEGIAEVEGRVRARILELQKGFGLPAAPVTMQGRAVHQPPSAMAQSAAAAAVVVVGPVSCDRGTAVETAGVEAAAAGATASCNRGTAAIHQSCPPEAAAAAGAGGGVVEAMGERLQLCGSPGAADAALAVAAVSQRVRARVDQLLHMGSGSSSGSYGDGRDCFTSIPRYPSVAAAAAVPPHFPSRMSRTSSGDSGGRSSRSSCDSGNVTAAATASVNELCRTNSGASSSGLGGMEGVPCSGESLVKDTCNRDSRKAARGTAVAEGSKLVATPLLTSSAEFKRFPQQPQQQEQQQPEKGNDNIGSGHSYKGTEDKRYVNPFLLSGMELKLEQQQSRIGGGRGSRRTRIQPFLMSSWELKQQQLEREQQEQREREIEANPESLEVYMNPFFLSNAERMVGGNNNSSSSHSGGQCAAAAVSSLSACDARPSGPASAPLPAVAAAEWFE